MKLTGTVKWFHVGKGYGFVTQDETRDDFFLHFSDIAMDGFKQLKAGDLVEFEAASNAKGKYAKNVVKIGEQQ